MKRLISLAAVCAAAITLSACSTESPVPSEASKSAVSSTDIQQVSAEEILDEFDLEGLAERASPHRRAGPSIPALAGGQVLRLHRAVHDPDP